MLGKIDDMAPLTKGRENKEEKRGKEEREGDVSEEEKTLDVSLCVCD